MHNIKVCNFHSHLGSELLDDFFVPEENKAVSTFLTFADKLCDKFKKDGSRGGFLVMDVFVQVLYLYLMAHKGEKLAIEVKAPDIIKDIKDIKDINKAIDIIKEMIKEINNKDLSSCQVACSRFIKKSVKATKTKLFDDAYVARGIYFVLNSDLKNKTIELLDSQSNYMELSLDITDLTEKKNKYVERDISNKRIALLHMTNKHHQALSHDDYNAELELYEFAKKFKTLQDDWLTRSSASPLIGVDWLAPEGYEFEHNRTVRIVGNFLDILNEKAKASGNNALQSCEKVVFRPHVGEGCSVFNGDQSHTPLMRDPKAFMVNAWGAVTTFIDTVDQNNSKEPKELKNIKPSSGLERYVIGEFARYMGGDDFSIGGKKYDELKRRAINNTRVMVVAIATWINKNPGHKLMFRLGHVTHCDSKTADIIKRYDIYVDLNLGSNIRTGALNAAPGFGAIDYARRKLKRNDPNAKVAYNSVGVIEEIHKLWGIDVYKDSGFYQLIKAGCKILIGDDGVGVEATEIDDEYRRVQAVFNSYKNLENNLYNGKDFYEVLYVHQSNWFRELYKDGDDRYNNISRVVAL
ncbi:TPA: hypothetical protein P2R03_003051 [Aeromonas veronii]|nr:hypothetical protein [Aeromonas veronii]